MSLKTARIITVIIAVNILFALSSCARYNGDTTDGQSTMSSHGKFNTAVIENTKRDLVESHIEFDNIGIATSGNFYDMISNASYDVYINKDNALSQIYKVQFNEDLYRIDYYNADTVLKAIYYDKPKNVYHLVNFSTNTSMIISYDEINKSDKILPYSLVTPEHYQITREDYLSFIKKEDVEGLNCLVYDVYNNEEILTKRIYISEKYKIIVKVEDFLNKVTTSVKNFSPDIVTEEAVVELKKIPVQKENKTEVPVEGQASELGLNEEVK